MRTKSFQKYVEKRLSKEQIEEIERKAEREIEELRAQQHDADENNDNSGEKPSF